MRITFGRVRPGMWAEYERRYKEIVDSGIASGGVTARWLLRDLDDPDAGFTVSVWDSEASMRKYSTDPVIRGHIQERFKDLFTGDFETHQCEVRIGSLLTAIG